MLVLKPRAADLLELMISLWLLNEEINLEDITLGGRDSC